MLDEAFTPVKVQTMTLGIADKPEDIRIWFYQIALFSTQWEGIYTLSLN
jgi:hypothetical protein